MDYLILALATWRLSALLAYEAGPADIFRKLRHAAGVRYNEQSEPYGENNFATGLICVWCNSVWVAFCLTILYNVLGEIAVWMLLPFALSAAAVALERINE